MRDSFKVPKKMFGGVTRKFKTAITNSGPDMAGGVIRFDALLAGSDLIIDTFVETFSLIGPGETEKMFTSWEALFYDNELIEWTATIIADGDTNLANNSLSTTMLLRFPR